MTDVVKRNGKKEQFKPQKLRKAVENAITDAGYTVTEQMSTIEQATQDVENMTMNRNEISSKEIRNEVVNDLESNAPKAAQSWRNYERTHGIR